MDKQLRVVRTVAGYVVVKGDRQIACPANRDDVDRSPEIRFSLSDNSRNRRSFKASLIMLVWGIYGSSPGLASWRVSWRTMKTTM
jgi:hypothetical protein